MDRCFYGGRICVLVSLALGELATRGAPLLVALAAAAIPSGLAAAPPLSSPVAFRLREIQTARVALQRQTSAAWRAVAAADTAEIAALNSATTAAMKAGNAPGVVAAQNLIGVVRARLAQEKSEAPFPPYFQAVANVAGLAPPVLALEERRNKAVAAALAQERAGQKAFRDAVLAADKRAVEAWRARVNSAMKAGKAAPVVAAMSWLKEAQQQLRHDSFAAPGRPLAGIPGQLAPPVRAPGPPVKSARNLPRGFPAVETPPTGGETSAAVDPSQWPGLVERCAKLRKDVPTLNELLEYHLVPVQRRVLGLPATARAGALKRFDSTWLGRPVGVKFRVQSVTPEPNGGYNVRGRLFWRAPMRYTIEQIRERRAVNRYGAAIRRAARLRFKAEYRYQLRTVANVVGASINQVPDAVYQQMLHERAQADHLAGRNTSPVLKAILRSAVAPWQEVDVQLPATASSAVKLWRRGQWCFIYGVVVGEGASVVRNTTPPLGLPSVWISSEIIPAESFPAIPCNPYIQTTSDVAFVSFVAPHSPPPLGPVTGYLFELRNGKSFQCDTYKLRGDEYDLTLDGIPEVVWKDQLLKIVVLHGRKSQ